MGSERRDKVNQSLEALKTPGPGTYAPRSFVGEGPKIAIKARNNAGFSPSNVPGPGTYQPSLAAVAQKTPSISLGRERRDNLINRSGNAKVPGPGAYPVHNRVGGPKFGFGSGTRGKERLNEGPGPGTYNIGTTIGDLPPHEKSKHL
eukprot:TRINITY_DN8431_c0_g2_i4.p2 TRINITY_DN8431_c0_g2~~TRINITY_DN8431_c0_g2_i4.p2  ORF type:complete len:147 (+),score=13.19 TRINITY_DN8431_c0_g2_i4:620-1060(+)